MKNIKMNHAVDGKYEVLHPETNMGQVIDSKTGVSLEEMLTGEAGSNLTKIQSKSYVIESTVSTQTEFTFNHEDFSLVDNIVSVHLNGEFMYEGKEYTIVEGTPFPKVKLVSPVPLGSSVHVTVMSNFSIGSTLSENNLNRVESIELKPVTYYLDAINGDDNRDGLSEVTAWKTIDKFNSVVATKRVGSIEVNMSPGEYPGNFTISSFHGKIYIKGDIINSDVVVVPDKTNEFYNIQDLTIDGVTFKGVTGSDHTITLSRIHSVRIGDSVIIDGATTGIYVEYTKLYISSLFKNITLRAMYLSVLAEVIAANHFYSPGESSRIDILAGARYQSYTPREGSTPELVNDWMNSSLDGNKINEGIILESGSNSNGNYIKYANGTLLCYRNIAVLGDLNVAVGDKFVSEVFTFPVPAVMNNSGIVILNGYPTNSNGTVELNNPISQKHSNNTWWQGYFINDTDVPITRILDFSMLYIGRWK